MQQKSSLNLKLKLGVERQKLRLIVSLTGPEDIQAQFQPLDWQAPTALWFFSLLKGLSVWAMQSFHA